MQSGFIQCFSVPHRIIQTLFVGMSQILITSTLLKLNVRSTNIGIFNFQGGSIIKVICPIDHRFKGTEGF